MLVLSRQKDESIIIGEGVECVEITIVAVRGDKVRLGIKAPKSVSVHRKEIYEAIQREKEAKLREIQNEENLKKLEVYEKMLQGEKNKPIFYIHEELENDIFDEDDNNVPSEQELLEKTQKEIEKRKEELKNIPDLPV
jgi:carbon storage regulator